MPGGATIGTSGLPSPAMDKPLAEVRPFLAAPSQGNEAERWPAPPEEINGEALLDLLDTCSSGSQRWHSRELKLLPCLQLLCRHYLLSLPTAPSPSKDVLLLQAPHQLALSSPVTGSPCKLSWPQWKKGAPVLLLMGEGSPCNYLERWVHRSQPPSWSELLEPLEVPMDESLPQGSWQGADDESSSCVRGRSSLGWTGWDENIGLVDQL
ncbi:UNVERIFIED_CONTAM: hypothetical protein K2H54_058322 [Gekko kuhli]